MAADISKARQGRKEKYIVPALRPKRKKFVVVHDTNQTVRHVSKFYHDNRVACIFVGEILIQIAPTDEVEPKFRTPCKSLMNSLSRT